MRPEEIRPGRCYSNGRYGRDWSVREVVDEEGLGEKDIVAFYVIAGRGRRNAGGCTRRQFAQWARDEVIRSESHWRRVGYEGS